MTKSTTLTVTPRMARLASLYGQRLQRLPRSLGKHPGLLFSPALEGYRDYTFGARSGPSVQARHIFHELGHAAQFGPEQFEERAGVDGYVFKMPQVLCMGRYYADPQTCKATERELDTFAHELHLRQAVGFKCNTEEFFRYSASVMRHMEDWAHVPGSKGKERHQECMRGIRERYEALTQAQVLDKLAGWLDKTQERLLGNPKRAYREVELRFRTDGSLLTA